MSLNPIAPMFHRPSTTTGRRIWLWRLACLLTVMWCQADANAQQPPRRAAGTPAAGAPAGAAQAAPAEPATDAAALKFAPAVPGICLFSRLAAIGGSKAGLAATIRMQQFANEITAELNAQRASIGAGSDSVGNIQERLANFSQLEQVRGLQLQRTKALVEQQISQAIGPILQPIITKQTCAVLIERTNAYGWDPMMDVTPAVIQELDDKLPSVQFTLATPESVR